MSVFDVHINRAPISGRIKRIAYVPGKFVNADLDKASEDNERQHFLIEGSDGMRIGFTQIAGLVARRILAFVREGDMVDVGQRVGLIRFGSRVDVYLPAGTAPQGAARPALDRRRDDHCRDGRRCDADRNQPVTDDRDPRRIPFRAMIPNAITALALCFGLTGVSFAIGGEWERALGAIILAGVLDGMDGRIARLLRAAKQVRRRAGFAVATISRSARRRR